MKHYIGLFIAFSFIAVPIIISRFVKDIDYDCPFTMMFGHGKGSRYVRIALYSLIILETMVTFCRFFI